MDSQDYIEIKVKVQDEDTGDMVVAQVSDLGFDSFMYEQGSQCCYIQSEIYCEAAFKEAVEALEAMLGIRLEWTAAAMPKVDWNSEWEKTAFTPIECGAYVVTPWVDGEASEGSSASCEGASATALTPIFLRPQMAFGSGHHHTTFMMMQAMQDNAERIMGASVMDLGCGTAVLAILAAKLGAAEVAAIDIDATAVRSAKDNIRLNGLDFPVLCGTEADMLDGAYDVLLANIHRNIIIAGLPKYAAAVRPGGLLLISGFLEQDVDDILSAAAENGFRPPSDDAVHCIGEWYCIELFRA